MAPTSLFALPLPLLTLAYTAAAQSSTPASFPAAASTTITTTINSTTSLWPVATIFLPIDVPPGLAASIITAQTDKTAYAIGCLQHYSLPDTDSDCDFGTSLVLTEGVSTLIYTLTYPDDTNKPNGATINCALHGGTRATAATCTGHSVIEGLGTVASTSTLASTQLSYAPVTITAGAVKLQEANDGMPETSTNTSTGGGPAAAKATGAADVRWVAGAVVVGIAGVVGVL